MHRSTDTELPGNYSTVPPFRAGEWSVYPARNCIEREDRTVTIEPRMMHVLVCLAASPGGVVSRETLLQVVWHDTVVNEESLTRNISSLRQALNDDTRSPRYIETIWKVGYRLLADVESLRKETGSGPVGVRVAGARSWIRAISFGLAGVVVIALVIFALRQKESRPSQMIFSARPLTSATGAESSPAVSPDGSHIAFCARSENGDLDIHVVDINGREVAHRRDPGGDEMIPVWSPDGRSLAYIRRRDDFEIRVAGLDGGPERTIRKIPMWIFGLDWSPDGNRLVYSARVKREAPDRIILIDLEGVSETTLTEPGPAENDRGPRFSPDGSQIAFMRVDRHESANIHLVPVAGGLTRKINRYASSMRGIAWSPEDGKVIASAFWAGSMGLWKIDPLTGDEERIVTLSERAFSPATAREGNILVYEALSHDVDICCVRVADTTLHISEPEALISSTRPDHGARFSPEGDRIAFLSFRSGRREIWLSDAGGGNQQRLTEGDYEYFEDLRWSPDGRWIACTIMSNGRFRVAIVDPETGTIREMAGGEGHRYTEGWSADGEWVYAAAPSGDTWRLVRIALDGTGEEPVCENARHYLGEDRLGCVYFREMEGKEVFILPDPLAAPRRIAGRDLLGDVVGLVIRDGILHIAKRDADKCIVLRHDIDTAVNDTIAILPLRFGEQLHVAPDGETCIANHLARYEQDLMIVSEFR